jgi:hypothetical protein
LSAHIELIDKLFYEISNHNLAIEPRLNFQELKKEHISYITSTNATSLGLRRVVVLFLRVLPVTDEERKEIEECARHFKSEAESLDDEIAEAEPEPQIKSETGFKVKSVPHETGLSIEDLFTDL